MVDASGTASVEHVIYIPVKKLDDLCIYRVPPMLRQVNAEAYTPQLISIGPFHHGKPQFKAMETHKRTYYHEFQERIKPNKSFGKFKDPIAVQDIRKCYADKFVLGDNQFADMIELDTVFIMEFFLRLKDQDQHKDDYVMSKPWLKDGICLDLILLENQLPIHVLNELYEFVPKEKENPQGEKVCSICSIKKETGKECCTFLDLACKCGFFEPCPVCKCVCNPPKNPKSENECKHTPTKNAKHLTDLRRCFYIPKLPDSESESESDSDSGSDSFITYSATKLHDSGISFKAARERYSLDVNFKNHSCIFWLFSFITCFKITKALLQIPKLIIEDGTERELRNLIALEQCHYPDHSHICNYVSLIDDLIETKEDVDFLLDEKIIVNHLGSNDEAEKLVNSLCKELVMGPGLFQNQIKELNAHYENPFNRTMATLRSVYFKDLWRGSATIVGLAVLAFTFVNFFRPTHK